MRTRWSRNARNDLVGIFEYIVQENPSAAAKIYLRLREAASSLAEFPYSGRPVPEFPHASIRDKIVAPYRIIYLVADQADEVRVLTVRHTRRRRPPVELDSPGLDDTD